MKDSKTQTAKIVIIFACIILIAFSVIALVFSIEVVSNKNTKKYYSNMGDTETRMLEEVQAYLSEHNKKLDKPVAFVRNNGIFRGRAYVFNVPLTEHELAYGLNGGAYSAEILLPDEYDFPAMYRCSAFEPGLGSFLFPSDYGTEKLCGEDVYVISFTDETLSDGNFDTLLEKTFGA